MIRKNKIKLNSYRNHWKFIWFPTFFEETNSYYWFEWVYIRQCYMEIFKYPRWVDICLVNPKTEVPIHLENLNDGFGKNESIDQTKQRFIDQGVSPHKIILTESPSVVKWDVKRNTFSDNYSSDGDITLISLNVWDTIPNNIISQINNSKGIIVTNATYGKQNFRFNFIP